MKLFLLSLFSVVSIYLYKLSGGFFQQDEWYGYAWYILHKNLSFWETISFYFAPNVGHYNPLSIALNHTLFSIWGMNYSGFLILSLALHFLISFLVYIFSRNFFDRKSVWPYITASLFAITATHFEATSWVIANIATQMSTLAGLVSVIYYFKFIKLNKVKYFTFSLITLFISLLFKEVTIGLFPLFIVIYFIFKSKKYINKSNIIIASLGLLYIILRALMFFSPNITGDQVITESQSTSKLLYNFATVPFKSITQSLLPLDFLKLVSTNIGYLFPEKIAGTVGSPQFETFVLKRIFEFISIFVSLLIVTALYIYRRNKNSKIVSFGILWVVINSLIFSFAPEKSGVIFTVDSRNLYFVSIGICISIVNLISKVSPKRIKLSIFVLATIFVFNLYYLNLNLNNVHAKGVTRRKILSEISEFYPRFPQKTIILTESDSSYYGLPDSEKILPFQSGLGQTLLAWYYSSEKYSTDFYSNRFLWEIKDQGYEEYGNRGFGYFRDYDLFVKAIKKYNLPKESVIAFKWISAENKLLDITNEVRGKIYGQINK